MRQFLRRALCAAALALPCASAAAPAQPQQQQQQQQQQQPAARADEQEEDPCPGARTQQDLNLCASRAFQQADAELNKLYQQLLKDAGAAERAKLRAAQLAWLKFRDAHCEYEAFGNTGGSIYPMVYGFCRAEVTGERARQFRDTLKEVGER